MLEGHIDRVVIIPKHLQKYDIIDRDEGGKTKSPDSMDALYYSLHHLKLNSGEDTSSSVVVPKGRKWTYQTN